MHGTTTICPTVSAAPLADMARSVQNIKAAMADGRVQGTIPGAHLEGPYLSRRQSGAQCADFITAPCEREYLPLLEEYGDVIARWSYAPENDEGQRFARALAKHGVLAAAGHTDATYKELKPAMQEGCRLITHLYSCTSTATRDHGFRRLVRVAVKEAGIPLTDAVRMITATPARIMGLAHKGSIAPGMDADLVVFDEEITVKKVFVRGREVK